MKILTGEKKMEIVIKDFETPEVLDVTELIKVLAIALIEEAKSEDGLKITDTPSIISKASDKFMPAIEGSSNIKLEIKNHPEDVAFAFAVMGRDIAKKYKELNK